VPSSAAEVGLVVGETCQFGYVNLGRFHTGSGVIPVDWDALTDTVRILVRALDDAIEASLAHYPSTVSAQVMSTKRKLAPVELATRRGPCPAVRTGRSRYADPAFLTRFADLQVRSVTIGNWEALAGRSRRPRETPTHCAIREVGEELGIKLDPGELSPAGVMSVAPWNPGWTSFLPPAPGAARQRFVSPTSAPNSSGSTFPVHRLVTIRPAGGTRGMPTAWRTVATSPLR